MVNKEGRDGRDRETGADGYIRPCIKQKDLPYGTGNYCTLCRDSHGNESKKAWLCL